MARVFLRQWLGVVLTPKWKPFVSRFERSKILIHTLTCISAFSYRLCDLRKLEKQALSKRSLPHNRILCGVGWAHLHQGLDRSDNKLSIHSIVIYLLYIAVYSVHPFPFAPFAQSLWTVIPYLVAWSERNRLQAAGSWTVVTDGHELSGEHKFIINPLLIDSSTSGKISTFRLGCIQPFQAQLAKIISNSSLRFSYVFRDQKFCRFEIWKNRFYLLSSFWN